MTTTAATVRAAAAPANGRGGPGLSVVEARNLGVIFLPPKGWRGYTEQQRRTWRNCVARELRFRRFLEANPHLAPSARTTYAAYGEHDATWLEENGLTAGQTVMYHARRVLCERRELPRRGRLPGSGKCEWHPRAEYLCDQLLCHTHGNRANIRETLKAFAAKEGFPAPTERMIDERIAGTPKGSIMLAPKGEGALDAMAPKGRRPRKSKRGWVSLDCRIMDLYV
jgi:hypothetical protein